MTLLLALITLLALFVLLLLWAERNAYRNGRDVGQAEGLAAAEEDVRAAFGRGWREGHSAGIDAATVAVKHMLAEAWRDGWAAHERDLAEHAASVAAEVNAKLDGADVLGGAMPDRWGGTSCN